MSFGQSAIFLIGGTSENDPVDALFLRSGDVLVMSGTQRLVYHAVPRVLSGQTEFAGANQPIVGGMEDNVLDYANRCRVNITVRQVGKRRDEAGSIT